MNVSVITGSRADYGHLEWPLKLMREDPFFSVAEVGIWGAPAPEAMQTVATYLADAKPDIVLVLGDRFEILSAAIAAHLQRIPIAHLCGGDVTEGSYDDAMRDCISRLATMHFPSTFKAAQRLQSLGYRNVHNIGSTTHDYIINAEAQWKRERPFDEPYVVVGYQAETIDGTVDLEAVTTAIAGRNAVWLKPNLDAGNDVIPGTGDYSHADFLNLIHHCEEFIGNSSAILYEAPVVGCKTRLIGKRQKGRQPIPRGDGKATERLIAALKKCSLP